MAPKKRKSLVRPGGRSQKTREGLEIPVPTREDFFTGLKRVVRKQTPQKPSEPEKERR